MYILYACIKTHAPKPTGHDKIQEAKLKGKRLKELCSEEAAFYKNFRCITN